MQMSTPYLIAYTVMQGSNLFFLTWYKTMFLMSVIKKGLSAKEMQRQLGLRRYEPVWGMVYKLCKAMGNRMPVIRWKGGMLELDEDYFIVEASEVEKKQRS